MTRMELVRHLLRAAQQYQIQAAHDEQGCALSLTEKEWSDRVAHWQQRLLALEVGYAGGCPDAIRHLDTEEKSPC